MLAGWSLYTRRMYWLNIYGPPGVGKLSVAKELARKTGFKLIDNHTTIDWACRFFDFGTERFWRLENRLRVVVLEEATNAGLSLIATWLPRRQWLWHTSINGARPRRAPAAGGAASSSSPATRLSCRLQSPGRSEAGKLTKVEVLHRMMEQTDFFSPAAISGHDSLYIDNTDLSASEVADQIVCHYQLASI